MSIRSRSSLSYMLLLATGLTSRVQADTAATDAKDQLVEIVVTAERREQDIQKVPDSITAITADQLNLQNIDEIGRLQHIVPGVKIFEIGVQPSIFIRGIGGPVANILDDPTTSYNVDGVVVTRPSSTNGLFFDLDRVEVLKGPQGTLYGGNATVGSVNLVSHRPEFKDEGSASLTLGDYNLVKTQGVVNVMLNDAWAIRVGFETDKHDGYITNGTDDADDTGGRIKVLYKPNDDLSMLLTGSVFHSGGAGIGDVPLHDANGNPGFVYRNDPWRVNIGPDLDPANGSTSTPDTGHQDLITEMVSAQVDWNVGVGELSIIPAYLRSTYDALTYSGGFGQNYDNKDEQLSLELHLASTQDAWDRLKWQVGLLGLRDYQESLAIQHLGPGFYQINPLVPHLKSLAAFTQETWSFTDRLRLTAGLRVSNDKKTLSGISSNDLLVPGASFPDGPYIELPGTLPSQGNESKTTTTYRVGLDYSLTADSLIYANVSTGYKVGGVNQGLPPTNPMDPSNIYQPEKLTSFQVGSKNEFLEHRLQFNAEAWYWNYRDFQNVGFAPVNSTTGPTIAFSTFNAEKAKNYGVEIQSSYLLTPVDMFTVNVQFDKAKYVSFLVQAIPPPFGNGLPSNYSGDTFGNAPEWTGTLGYQHTFSLGAAGSLIASAQHQFASNSLLVFQNIPGQKFGATNITDAQLTYRPSVGKWEAGLYCENLENNPFMQFAGVTPAGLWGHPGNPRNYGAKISTKF